MLGLCSRVLTLQARAILGSVGLRPAGGGEPPHEIRIESLQRTPLENEQGSHTAYPPQHGPAAYCRMHRIVTPAKPDRDGGSYTHLHKPDAPTHTTNRRLGITRWAVQKP